MVQVRPRMLEVLRNVTGIKRAICGSLLLIGAAVSACGSAAPSASAEAAAGQDFAAQATTQVCNALGACCGAASFPFDATECSTAIGPAIAQQFEAEAIPGTHLDTAAAQRCLSGIQGIAQSCTAPDGFLNDDCRTVFVGTVPVGGHCDIDTACAPENGVPAVCVEEDLDDPDLPGTCKLTPTNVAPHGKLGDACNSTCIQGACIVSSSSAPPACYTSDGLDCSLAGQCVAQGVAGDSCRSSPECGVDTYCDATATRQCQPVLGIGDACRDQAECESRFCPGSGPPMGGAAPLGVCSPPPLSEPGECLGHSPAPAQ
jgi:hypothetical protein